MFLYHNPALQCDATHFNLWSHIQLCNKAKWICQTGRYRTHAFIIFNTRLATPRCHITSTPVWRLCCVMMLLSAGGTPLNNPPIEIHANSSMFALIFWPHVTIFCIFWLHECLKWILEFNSKSLFWCQSRQIFEVRAIEQRHHEFQLIHIPPHQFWPRYHSDGLSPVHVRFEFFSKQICNVEALICHFYKNIKTLTQIHFPRDAHIFRTCTIFYRHYKGLHQMRKDLVLCALWRDFLNFFFIFRILGQNQEKVSFLVDLRCSKVTK